MARYITSASARDSASGDPTIAEHDCMSAIPSESQGQSQVRQSSPHSRRRTRRRAATACRFCRVRKTKCDNQRPTCSYCRIHGAVCEYSEELPVAGTPTVQAESSQPISNALLLERVNHAVKLLEELRAANASHEILNFQAEASTWNIPHSSPRPAAAGSLDVPGSSAVAVNTDSAFTDYGFGQVEIPEPAAKTNSCEAVLQWPALREFWHGPAVVSFPLQYASDCDDERLTGDQGPRRVQPGLGEECIWSLCRKFQTLIHIKNPILEVGTFERYVREVVEFGPGWDGPGCLVLIACALASIATPYDPRVAEDALIDGRDTASDTSSEASNAEALPGDAYFSAARRRMGLLPRSLLSIQCYYFAALYEKFAVRPMAAWSLLQTACVQLQAYLYSKSLSPNLEGGSRRARHLEQRLYWSCIKAECELRAELQLPSSALLQFKYPDLFPSLSFPMASERIHSAEFSLRGIDTFSPASQTSSALESVSQLAPEEERSWLYYLAEISLRKIMSRILEGLYNAGEAYWTMHLGKSMVQSRAFQEELTAWRAHLPAVIQFSDQGVPDNELAFFLKTRYLICCEWIHRPFLFWALHHEQQYWSPETSQLAQCCLQCCSSLIRLIYTHHCHGGIWGLVRKSFTYALLFIAAARKGGLLFRTPNTAEWSKLVALSVKTIRQWEKTAPDLHRMRNVLQEMLKQ